MSSKIGYKKEITLDIFKSVNGELVDELKQHEKIVTSKPPKKKETQK